MLIYPDTSADPVDTKMVEQLRAQLADLVDKELWGSAEILVRAEELHLNAFEPR